MDGDSAHAVLPMMVVGDVGWAPRTGPPDRPLSSTGIAKIEIKLKAHSDRLLDPQYCAQY